MKTNNPRPFSRRLLSLAYLTCFAYLMLGLVSCSPNVDGGSPQIVTFTLTPSSLVLKLKESANITAQVFPTNTADTNLTWTSSRPDIATVSNGMVTALYGGTANITVAHGSGAAASVAVKVLQPATNMALITTNFTLGVGESRTIAVQFLPTNANTNTDITWVSSNTAIATVANGVVTGNSSGTTNITATWSGTTFTVTVTVLPTPNLSYRGVGCPADTSRLTLTWDNVPGATRYEVFRDKGTTPIATLTNNFLHLPDSSPGSYVFEVKACDGGGCSQPGSLTATVTTKEKTFSNLITSGSIPSDLSGYGISQTIFSNYPARAKVTPRYVAPGGNVKTVLDGIKDASASNVYAVLIPPGTYNAGAEMGMKDNIAIIGGQCSLDTNGNTPTVLSGGGTRRVFSNNGITNTAVLYGVTIADGYTTGDGGGMYNTNAFPVLIGVTVSGNTANNNGGGMNNSGSSPVLTRVIFFNNRAVGESLHVAGWGGGMYNHSSSPILTGVTLSGNKAQRGGGMYNTGSSPILTGVTFSRNTATTFGGGMYNVDSYPILTGVTLSGNKAGWGGGMYNLYSSPILTGVTLSGNKAGDGGGGVFNFSSSPILTGVTLSGNTAGWGGGMYNQVSSPILTGVTFFENTAPSGGGMYNTGSSPMLLNTILWGNGTEISGSGSLIHYSIVAGVNNSVDPGLLPLADNGGGILTHAIPTTSSAVNQGIYVRRSAAPTGRGCDNECDTYTYYYSPDNNKWYSDPELTTDATPPADAVDLTATDATRYRRSGRPDIGAYEAR